MGVDGKLTIKLDKDKLTQAAENKIIDKCTDAEFFRFKITSGNQKYKFNIFSTKDCLGTALVSLDMTEALQSVSLPPIQEEITIDTDVKVAIGLPYGCLLSFLPEISGKVKADFNIEFVHTQFGADIHTYSNKNENATIEKCKGEIDEIISMFSGETRVNENGKLFWNDQKLNISSDLKFASGAMNMFQNINSTLYEYKDKLPSLTDKFIYEYNGEKMKIYSVVEVDTGSSTKKVVQFVQDAIVPKLDAVIGKLVDNAGKEFSITSECDPSTGISFGYLDGKLQQTVAGKGNCNFNVNGINLNIKLNVSAVLGTNNKMKINDVEYTFTQLSDYAKNLKTQTTAIVESIGSYMEYELNKCKPINLLDLVDTFTELATKQFAGNPLAGIPYVEQMIQNAIKQGNSIKKLIEERIKTMLPSGMQIPDFYHKISMLKTGSEGKYFATFTIYNPFDKTCSQDPINEFVVGIVSNLTVNDIKTGYELIKYLKKEDCSTKNGTDNYYKEHVGVQKCINGFKFSFDKGQLKMVPCTSSKRAVANDNTNYKCGTCIECEKKAAMSGDYTYVKCSSNSGSQPQKNDANAASSIFLMLVALIFMLF